MKKIIFPFLLLFAILSGAYALAQQSAEPSPQQGASSYETAIVAGGCFWCVEADFDKLDGVVDTLSGYTGGAIENPSYEQVSYTETGHYEAVKITYDPAVVSYETITEYFFRHVDPLDDGGQFCDRGSSYRTAIFVANDEQRAIAQAAKTRAETILKRPIVTPIIDAGAFWAAEKYHQNYYKKNPVRYRYYRTRCGRDRRINELWGDTD